MDERGAARGGEPRERAQRRGRARRGRGGRGSARARARRGREQRVQRLGRARRRGRCRGAPRRRGRRRAACAGACSCCSVPQSMTTSAWCRSCAQDLQQPREPRRVGGRELAGRGGDDARSKRPDRSVAQSWRARSGSRTSSSAASGSDHGVWTPVRADRPPLGPPVSASEHVPVRARPRRRSGR